MHRGGPDVHPGVDHPPTPRDASGTGREAAREIAEEGRSAFTADLRKPRCDSAGRGGDAHDVAPSTSLNQRAAVSTSLSPRPERLTRTIPSGPSSRPATSAPALSLIHI